MQKREVTLANIKDEQGNILTREEDITDRCEEILPKTVRRYQRYEQDRQRRRADRTCKSRNRRN